MLGSALGTALREAGWMVHRITRNRPERPGDVAWDPALGQIDLDGLEGADAVAHLAGEPLDARWTVERKQRIRESRVGSTMLLAGALARLSRPPQVLLSASAVGYYGNRGDEQLTEESSAGSDFLAATAAEWERATGAAGSAGIRVVLLRSGVVLSPLGGALAKMLLPFRLGLGGRFGSGRQWTSWITLHDWIRAVLYLLESEISGPVNLVAPDPVRNAEFAAVLGRVLGRPALLPLPAALLQVPFGSEMVRSTILASQRALPRRLIAAGFLFDHPTLERGLAAELGS